MTDEVIEIPRCCSSRIQSEVACRAALRPLTVPAIEMAPPNSSSFSVRVVLPASGCEMIANVLRRLISLDISASVTNQFLEYVHGYVHVRKARAADGGHRAAPGALSGGRQRKSLRGLIIVHRRCLRGELPREAPRGSGRWEGTRAFS